MTEENWDKIWFLYGEIIDNDGCHHEGLLDWLGHQFKLCGCGAFPEEIRKDMFTALVLLYHRTESKDSKPMNEWLKGPHYKYREFILQVYDSFEYIEHGGSIGGSWLNDKGKELIEEAHRISLEHCGIDLKQLLNEEYDVVLEACGAKLGSDEE